MNRAASETKVETRNADRLARSADAKDAARAALAKATAEAIAEVRALVRERDTVGLW